MKGSTPIITIIILSVLTCCTTYKLEDKDVKLNPYQVNDTLIFQNNLNDYDTVIITGVDSYINPTDPLSLFADNTEMLVITARQSDPYGRSKIEGEFLKISRTKDSVYINYALSLKDATSWSALNSVELRNLNSETVCFFGKEYPNVVKIHSSGKERQYDLAESIYWSNEYGYVKAEMSRGKYWYLVERIRK